MNEEVQTMEDGVVAVIPDVDAEFAALENENKKLKHKLGAQGNEIGEKNRIIDQFIQQQPTQSSEDWDIDPMESKVKALESKISLQEQRQQLTDLESKYPNFRDLPNDPAFQEWVQGSPLRQTLYSRADQMDFNSATEMLDLWNEHQSVANQTHQESKATRKKQLNAASMEKGSAGSTGRKVYSRTWLIDQKINNPTWYDVNRDEIMKAYAEGRVRK